MLTSIKRELRNLLRAAPNDIVLERIKEADAILHQNLNDCDLVTKIDCFAETLCESLKFKEVELSTLALQSLRNLITSDHINGKSLQLITDHVTKIEFTSTESELVEEGYYQAVRVCSSMLKCKASSELTNGSISEIIIFCFRVVNSKLVKWLRSRAVRALVSITKILFLRVHEFEDDPTLKPSYQIRLRLGGASSQSTFKELADQSLSNDNSSATTSTSLRIINERNQPYNLAFINDFFCYLASLINPNTDTELNKTIEDKILFGLQLLKVIFNTAAEDIGRKSCLTYTTRNNICCNLVLILKTVRSSAILNNALHLAADIFIDLRHHLKYQFEAFLERLMEMLVANLEQSAEYAYSSSNEGAAIELKSDVLSTVLELFHNIKHFPHELYYNYDCDPYSSNIYENLIQICSKNCFQHTAEPHFTPIQLTSFKCLLANLADIHSAEMGDSEFLIVATEVNSSKVDGDVLKSPHAFDLTRLRTRFPTSYDGLNEAKKRKRLLWLAIEKFNSRPKDGIQFINENKLCESDEEVVNLLKDNLRVDKKILGEFLSKEDSRNIRDAFIKSLDFMNLRIDEALRCMLEKFRLPGESQLIERILDTFSLHWTEQNSSILPNSDSALSLAYAIIMLNVDQHSKKVKPMTCNEFDRNLLGPKSERIYDKKLLDMIYTSIRDDEIVLPDEQTGFVRQRYLWKCTLIKSERIDSLYWITGFQTDRVPSVEPSQEPQETQPQNSPQQTPSMQQTVISNLPDATVLVIDDPDADDSQVSTSAISQRFNDRLYIAEENKILFEIMWSPTIAALSFIFDKVDTSVQKELSKQIVDYGFIKIAKLCARYGHLDNLVVSLCKFTTDLSPVPHNHSGQKHLMSDKNSLAALSLLTIIRIHANNMRSSWTNIVKNILQWYCLKCIDDVVQVDDFALQRKLKLRMREVKKTPSTMNQQSSTFLRSVYTLFAGQPTSDSQAQNGSGGPSPPSAVQVLIQAVQEAEYCQEALIELISALTTTSIDGAPEEVEDAEVFKLEIFTQVVLNNRRQATIIWPRIPAYFARQLTLCGRSVWHGERIISAAFRIAILFKPKSEVLKLLNHIITALDAEIIRGNYTFTALMTLTELHAPSVSMDAKELEVCFGEVIFPFLDKVLDGCDPVQNDKTLNKAINLLSKIFLKHHKILKELQGFALLWYKILDAMDKYIRSNPALKEATFELVKNMVLVMDNEQCMSVEMKDSTRTKFMFWEFQSGSDY